MYKYSYEHSSTINKILYYFTWPIYQTTFKYIKTVHNICAPRTPAKFFNFEVPDIYDEQFPILLYQSTILYVINNSFSMQHYVQQPECDMVYSIYKQKYLPTRCLPQCLPCSDK